MAKTLQQIFEEQGSKFPFRITLPNSVEWTELHYKHEGKFFGHDSFGFSQGIAEICDWFIPYTEPKKKVKLWPYLSWHYVNKKGAEVHWYTSKKEAKAHCGRLYIGPHPTLEPIEIEAQDD